MGRALGGGLTLGDAIAIGSLRVQHTQLDFAMRAASQNKLQAPKLEVFVPDLDPEPEPVVRDFGYWAERLLPLAGGATIPRGSD